MSYSDEVHRRYQNNIYLTRRIVGENIEDYWNVDGEKELSDAWTGFTRCVLLKVRPREGYTWFWRRVTRKQKKSRPDDVWPDMWKFMSDAAKKKAKQIWLSRNQCRQCQTIERNIFIEPNDEEFKLTMKAARRKLEFPMPAAMPCKIPIKRSGKNPPQYWETQGKIRLCC